MDEAISTGVELFFDKAFEYVQIDSIPFAPDHIKKRLKNFFSGWHVTVSAAVFLSSCVLAANVIILIWAACRNLTPGSGDILQVFRGNCSQMQTIFTWTHVGINVLSTLLLASSNSACQVLSAPTRKEIDIAHAHGIWLDVGVPSFRNLRHIALKRVVVYVLLGLSSVPLHLIYNSVIFPTTSSNDNLVVLANTRFRETPFQLQTYKQICDPYCDIIEQLHHKWNNTGSLEYLTKVECMQQFSSQFISEYSNFLIVTGRDDLRNATHGLIQWNLKSFIESSSPSSPLDWLCKTTKKEYVCHSKRPVAKPFHWQMFARNRGLFGAIDVDHCFAERVQPRCTVSISKSLLVTVIVCNFIKLVCFLTVVKWASDKPLVTSGDCISSFLRRPDISTIDMGPLAAADVRCRLWGKDSGVQPFETARPWRDKRRFWFAAAGKGRWIVAIVCYLIFYLPAASAPAFAELGSSDGFGSITNMGNLNANLVLQFTQGWSLSSNVLLVNLPQLIISACYLFFNAVLTSGLQASEYADFAWRRKSLRVTEGSGEQRSTYWLQIPYRYAIPSMALWTVFHWLVSQSIFLARINVYNYYLLPPPVSPTQSIDGCGFSPVAVLMAVVLGGIIILLLIGMGFRRYYGYVPIVGTCTAAIAAACHPASDEDEDMVYKPLKYGVLRDTIYNPIFGTVRRVGFSANKVDALVEGEVYR